MHPHTSLRPRQLLLAVVTVGLGGGVGTLVRDLALKIGASPASLPAPSSAVFLTSAASWTSQIPWTLLVINVIGVFVATRLLRGALRQHDPNNLTRLLVITGFFGGFTSYSGLYVDLATLWHLSIGGAVFVAILAVVSGVLSAAAGLWRVRR